MESDEPSPLFTNFLPRVMTFFGQREVQLEGVGGPSAGRRDSAYSVATSYPQLAVAPHSLTHSHFRNVRLQFTGITHGHPFVTKPPTNPYLATNSHTSSTQDCRVEDCRSGKYHWEVRTKSSASRVAGMFLAVLPQGAGTVEGAASTARRAWPGRLSEPSFVLELCPATHVPKLPR